MNVDKLLQELKEKCDLSFLDKTVDLVRFTTSKNTISEILANIIKCVDTFSINKLKIKKELLLEKISNLDNLCNYVENITDHTDNIIYYKIDYQDWKMTEFINGFIVFKYQDKYCRIYVDVKYDTDSYSDSIDDYDVINEYSLREYDSILDLFESNDNDLLNFMDYPRIFEYFLEFVYFR